MLSHLESWFCLSGRRVLSGRNVWSVIKVASSLRPGEQNQLSGYLLVTSLYVSWSKGLLYAAYFLVARPWNQSGKFPLCWTSGACVSVNHRSTSSFRPPPSCGSIFSSTPDLFSIYIHMWAADRAQVIQCAYSLLWRNTSKGSRGASFDYFCLSSESGYCCSLSSSSATSFSASHCTGTFILLSVFLVPDWTLTAWPKVNISFGLYLGLTDLYKNTYSFRWPSPHVPFHVSKHTQSHSLPLSLYKTTNVTT